MPLTYPIWQLGVFLDQNSELSYAASYKPEGASQTFVAGSPVVLAAGLIVKAADPVTDIWGFALRAGQNGTGKFSKVIPAFDGLLFFANFLTSGGATGNAIAAADVGGAFDIQENNILPPANTACWHVSDSAAAAACRMQSFDTDYTYPNKTGSTLDYHQVAVGDIDARVCFAPLRSIISYD